MAERPACDPQDHRWITATSRGIEISTCGPLTISHRQVDAVVQEIYRLAGRKLMVLNRCDLIGEQGTSMTFNGHRIERHGRVVHIPAARLSGDHARIYAGFIAQLGEIARDEPDPAELAELTNVIDGEEPDLRGGYAEQTPEAIARAILRRYELTPRPGRAQGTCEAGDG